jgi:hypothetical protein
MKKKITKDLCLEMIKRLVNEVEMHRCDYHHKTTPGLLDEANELLGNAAREKVKPSVKKLPSSPKTSR